MNSNLLLDRKPLRIRIFLFLMFLGIVLALFLVFSHITLGTIPLSPEAVLKVLSGTSDNGLDRTMVVSLRMPRALIALTCGTVLAMAGTIMQSLTRNPLASPSLTGVTSGSVLAAVIWLSTSKGLSEATGALPFVSLIGGFTAAIIVFLLSVSRKKDNARLILTGVLVSSILGSASSLLLLWNREKMGNILLYVIGSLNGRVWLHWSVAWPWALSAIVLAFLSMRVCNVIRLGDDIAEGLGMNIMLARPMLLVVAAWLTASAVSIVGNIGFIGLIAPHMARFLTGNDTRRVIPLSGVLGGLLLLGADILSQAPSYLITPASEWGEISAQLHRVTLPVGAVTAFLGVPFFLVLLWRRGK